MYAEKTHKSGCAWIAKQIVKVILYKLQDQYCHKLERREVERQTSICLMQCRVIDYKSVPMLCWKVLQCCTAHPSPILPHYYWPEVPISRTAISFGFISIHALSASLSHSHYYKTVKIVKDLESAGLCSLFHQLIMFYEHIVSFSSHHMQPDVLTWISSTSECCAVLWSYVQGKRHITEEANVFGSSSCPALWPQVLTGHVAIAAMKYFHLNPAFP